MRNAISDVASLHPAQIILRRKKWLHRWLGLAKDLEVEDRKMKSAASSERLVILKPKRLVLLKAIITEENYPDVGIADDIARGFDLVGKVPQSGTFTLPKKLSPSSLTISDLHSAALNMMTRSSGDCNMDIQLWDKTQSELQKGWLVGPINWDSLPDMAVVSRRFPIGNLEKYGRSTIIPRVKII